MERIFYVNMYNLEKMKRKLRIKVNFVIYYFLNIKQIKISFEKLLK